MSIVQPKNDYCGALCCCREQNINPDSCHLSVPTKASDKTERERFESMVPGVGSEARRRLVAFQMQHSPRPVAAYPAEQTFDGAERRSAHYYDPDRNKPLRRAGDAGPSAESLLIRLVNSTELNMDDMEPETILLLADVRSYLEKK